MRGDIAGLRTDQKEAAAALEGVKAAEPAMTAVTAAPAAPQ